MNNINVAVKIHPILSLSVVLVNVLKTERSKRKPIVTTVSKNLANEVHRFLRRKNERSALYRRHQAIEKEEQKHIYVCVCIYRPSLSLSLFRPRRRKKIMRFLVADRSIRHVRREEKRRRKRREKTRSRERIFFCASSRDFRETKKISRHTKRRDSRLEREDPKHISFFFLSLPPHLLENSLFSKSFRRVVVAESPLLVEKETNERGSFAAVVCARRLSRRRRRGRKRRRRSCSSKRSVLGKKILFAIF